MRRLALSFLAFMACSFSIAQSTSCFVSPPVNMDFESTPTYSNPGDHTLNSCWLAGSAASFSGVNWRVSYWDTPSGNTGPSGSASGQFLYMEASGSSSSMSDTVYFTSPQINLSLLQSIELQFDYHMYGAHIESLNVEVFDGSLWINEQSIVGEQQTSNSANWSNATIDLSAYSGDTIQIRFSAIRSGHLADIAIDNVVVQEPQPTVPPLTCSVPSGILVANIQNNSATVTYTVDSAAVSTSIDYALMGFDWDSLKQTITNNSGQFDLSQLEPGGIYQYHVYAQCSNGATDTVGPFFFTTTCPAFGSPYQQNFDSVQMNGFYYGYYPYGQIQLPGCWSHQITASANPWQVMAIPEPYWSYTDYGLRLANQVDTVTVVTPELNFLDSGVSILSFFGANYYPFWGGCGVGVYIPILEGRLLIGTMSDPADASTFHTLDTIILNSYFQQFETYISVDHGYNGTDSYVALRLEPATPGAVQSMMIDNVEIRLMGPCETPYEISANARSDSEVRISFNSPDSLFQIQWDTAGFALGTGTMDTVNTHYVDISSTTPNTSFEAYVRNSCASADSSAWAGPIPFKSECVAQSLPYSENFDQYMSGVYGDYQLDGVGNESCWRSVKPYSSLDGPRIFRLDSTDVEIIFWNEYGLSNQGIYSPILSGLDSTTLMVNFAAQNWWGVADVAVGFFPNEVIWSSFVPIDTVIVGPSPTDYTLYLDPNVINGLQVSRLGFLVYNLENYGSFVTIDNISICDTTSCSFVTDVQIDTQSNSSISYSWEGSQGNGYYVEYGPSGFSPNSGVGSVDSISTRDYTISGLSAGVVYDLYIRPNCGPGITTLWQGPFSAATSCAAQSIPYYEGFEVSVPGSSLNSDTPICWNVLKSVGSDMGANVASDNQLVGYNRLRMHSYPAAQDNGDTLAVVTPQILGLGLANNVLSFHAKDLGDNFYVGSLSDPNDLGTLEIVDTIVRIPTSGYQRYEVILDSCSYFNFQDDHLALVMINEKGFTGEVSVDSLGIGISSTTCKDVRRLSVNSIDLNSMEAKVRWCSTGNQFVEAKVRENGGPWTVYYSILSDSLVFPITYNSTYEVVVRNTCSSTWVDAPEVSFRTECAGSLSGSYTIGGAAQDFSSLQEAFDALKYCGIDSNVVFNVSPGTYSTEAILDSIQTTDPSFTVSFVGAGHSQTTIDLPNSGISYNELILVKNVHNVVFSDMQFLYHGEDVFAVYNCSNMKFKDCKFKINSGFWRWAFLDLNTSINVRVENCIFDYSHIGLNVNDCQNVSIVHNEFKNGVRYSLRVIQSGDILIEGNTIENTISGNYRYGIRMEHCTDFVIRQNDIHTYGRGIRIQMSDTLNLGINRIESNMVLSDNNSPLSLHGVSNVDVLSNTLVGNSATELNYSANISLHNNIFDSPGLLFYVDQSNGISTIDHNIYAGNGYPEIQIGGENFDFAYWAAFDTSRNAHSIYGHPSYVDPANDLHISGQLANAVGDSTRSAAYDIDGQPRPFVPWEQVDIGADEYTPFATPNIELTELWSDSTASCFGQNINVYCLITNVGDETSDSIRLLLNAGALFDDVIPFVLNPGELDTVAVLVPVFGLPFGPVTLSGELICANDSVLTNNTLFLNHEFFVDTTQVSWPLPVCNGLQNEFWIDNPAAGTYDWYQLGFNQQPVHFGTTTGPDSITTDPNYAVQTVYAVHQTDGSVCADPIRWYNYANYDSHFTMNFTAVLGTQTGIAQTMHFDASGSYNIDSVYWHFGDGGTGSGLITSNDYVANGQYAITAIMFDLNCLDNCDTLFHTVTIAGIGEDEFDSSTWNLYPNPSQGQFTIDFGGTPISGALEVVSATGQRVHFTAIQNEQKLDLDLDLAPGFYFVRVMTEENSWTKEISISDR